MKLRLRHFESKETLWIQVQSSSSIVQLQETLFHSLPPNPLYNSSSSLCFSLNAKDLLHAPSPPQASLRSLGVASGDLIYFSFNPNAFSSIPSAQTLTQIEEMQDSSADKENPVLGLPQFHEPMSNEAQVSQEAEGTDSMDTTHAFPMNGKFSEPYLLSMVLGEQPGDNRSIHNLLVTAVHAVLLDSGFVLINPVSGLQMDRFHLADEWPSTFSFCYSLPKHFRVDNESVVLKFQTLSQFFLVYGSLAKESSRLYRVSLDEYRFASTLDTLWANYLQNDTMRSDYYNDGSINSYPKTEVLKFWKIVKDELALPLLIDLSYSTGLSLPACLMSLPPDLKLNILDLLPATDIARIECVCSEFRTVASNDELWKNKVEEEFGLGDWLGGRRNWKERFHSCWESRKKRKRREVRSRRLQGFFHVRRPVHYPIAVTRAPNPPGGIYVTYADGYNTRIQYLGNA